MRVTLQLAPKDLYLVCELARTFYVEMGLPGKFVAGVFTKTWTALMNNNQGTIFCTFQDGLPIGGIGAIIFPDLYDGELVAMEAAWFVHPDHRKGRVAIELMNEFEKWAKKRKAKRLTMGYLHNSPEGVKRLLIRRGYVTVETHCVKTL